MLTHDVSDGTQCAWNQMRSFRFQAGAVCSAFSFAVSLSELRTSIGGPFGLVGVEVQCFDFESAPQGRSDACLRR